MSHLAPQAAIFSPSVARAAASAAKDWAYVDAWLRRQYANLGRDPNDNNRTTRRPPAFERNPDTLDALLALIAANEAADEERDRLADLEEAALEEVRAAEEEKMRRRREGGEENTAAEQATLHADLLAEDLLHAIDDGLSKEGRTALDAMADVALALDLAADPSPARLGHRFVELQGRAHETDQLVHRVGMLRSYLDAESARTKSLLEELRHGAEYQVDPHVGEQNAELERMIEDVSSKLPGLRRQVGTLEKTVGIPPLTVEEVRRDEEAYLDLLSKKKDLDAQVKAFAGLPPDIEAARAELETLRTQLRDATERRDAHFEMLVERESPVKVRTSRNSRLQG
ncbi:hypothetical protein F5Y19DRAFT_171342 [Xylariaceae sp. FL1651]|nr:hypothetical protein F5Y19DRAFT_171342 [Xylariaceae sp. FL1651]